MLEKQNHKEEAIEHLRLAVSLKPSYAVPYYALSRIYKGLGKQKEAKEALNEFRRLKQEERGN